MGKDDNLELNELEAGQQPAQAEEEEEAIDSARGPQSARDLEAVYDIPVQVSAVLGKATMQVSNLLKLGRGTVAVTTVCFSLGDIGRTQKAVALALFRSSRDPRAAAEHVLELAQLARNQGVLVLERQLAQLNAVPFLRRALALVVDGAAPEEVEQVMHQELMAIVQRHQKSASVLRRAAEVAPAMGLIGTLVGLVQM